MGPDRIGSLNRNKLVIFASFIRSKFGFQRDDCIVEQKSVASVKFNVLSYRASAHKYHTKNQLSLVILMVPEN